MHRVGTYKRNSNEIFKRKFSARIIFASDCYINNGIEWVNIVDAHALNGETIHTEHPNISSDAVLF